MSTYVVIPGAGDVPANFSLLEHELRERGQDAITVDLPSEDDSAGWNEYADAAVAAIGDRRELVIVAHSLGGFTAPLVCGLVAAEMLILVAAMIPLPGELAGNYWETAGYEDADEEADHDGSEIALFYHDMPRALGEEASARGRGQSERPMNEPWPLDAWPDVPTRYLLCREDRVFGARRTRSVVRERLGIEADEIDGGHCPFLSRPAELADRLVAYRTS